MKPKHHGRPSMKMDSHPAHNMPASEFNGTPLAASPMGGAPVGNSTPGTPMPIPNDHLGSDVGDPNPTSFQ